MPRPNPVLNAFRDAVRDMKPGEARTLPLPTDETMRARLMHLYTTNVRNLWGPRTGTVQSSRTEIVVRRLSMLALLVLAGCTQATADGACRAFPPPVAYSGADQLQALVEMDTLAADAVLRRMIEELGAHRARWRAVCR